MKTFSADIYKFIDYCKKNKIIILFSLIIPAVYSYKLLFYSVGIDTEMTISDYNSALNWTLGCGRFFSVFLNKIIMPFSFNYYFAILLEIVALILVYFGYNFVLYKNNITKPTELTFFSCILFTFPTYAELFYYFTNSGFNNAIAWLLAVISIYFISEWLLHYKAFTYAFIGAICGICAAGAYQAFLFIIISGILSVMIVNALNSEKTYTLKEIIFIITRFVSVIIGTSVTYLIVSKICVYFFYDPDIVYAGWTNANSYISNQLNWSADKITTNIANIYEYFKRSLFHKAFGSLFYPCSFIILFCISVSKCFSKNKRNYPYITLLICGLYICPYLGCILKGNEISAREQIIMPFVLAFAFIYIFHHCTNSNFIKNLFILLAVAISIKGFTVTYSLYSTDLDRYNHDIDLSDKIMTTIYDSYGNIQDKTIVFLGKKQYICPEDMLRGEMIGISFFEHDARRDWGINYRLHSFMEDQGYIYNKPAVSDISVAKDLGKSLGNWPDDNSIAVHDNLIIVKLSD